MKEIEKIDFAEIQIELQESLKDLEIEEIHLDKEMKNIDNLIEELEKLELQEK